MPIDPKRAQAVFLAASELADPAQRADFLAHECASDVGLRQRVEDLLRAHDDSSDLPSVPEATSAFTPSSAAPAATLDQPASIEPELVIAGRYTLVERIGEGGMGEVWMARQTEPVKRKVAVKLIKAGMDSKAVLARFEQERQALALMDHPNIAKVLDGGMTADRRPFFVMELVQGTALTEFCDTAKLGIRERLDLFVAVCQAVQHAHQKGIVHRDLKPSNILVTHVDGRAVPMVIDFGVAKAIGGKLTDESLSTQFGAVVGTLEYMSPEQAGYSGVDIDTRADIYSLGVILYELLAGSRPFDAKRLRKKALSEMIRMIQEDEPARPSTRLSSDDSLPSVAALRHIEPKQLTSLLRGELDWVVMKCLEKLRDRRYETANGLARDLQRFLTNEAVEARPPSFGYRLNKFLRRNRGPVLAAGLVLLALLGGIIGTTVGLFRAEEQRVLAVDAQKKEAARAEGEHRANLEAQTAKKLAEERLIEVKAEQKRTLEQKSLAEANQKKAEEQMRVAYAVRYFFQAKLLLQADAGQQADQLLRIGGEASEVDPNVTVRELLDRAAAQLAPDRIDRVIPDQPMLHAELLRTIGDTYRGVGENQKAIAFLKQSINMFQDLLPSDDPTHWTVRHALAQAYFDDGQYEEAIKLNEQILAARARILGPDEPNTIQTKVNLAANYSQAGQEAKAIQLLEGVRDLQLKSLKPNHLELQNTLGWLAFAYQRSGKVAQAIQMLEQVCDVRTKEQGADHPATLQALVCLARAYRAAGHTKNAIQIYERVRDLQTKSHGIDHPRVLNTVYGLAGTLRESGQVTDAIKLYEQLRDTATKKLGPEQSLTTMVQNGLALAYRDAGRSSEAIALYEQACRTYEKKLGQEHPTTLATQNNLAVAYQDVGRLKEAIQLMESTLDGRKKALGLDHPNTLLSLNNLGLAYLDANRLPEAIQLLEQAYSQQARILGSDNPDSLKSLVNLARAYRVAGNPTEAIKRYEQAIPLTVQKLGREHPTTITALTGMGVALSNSGRYAEAIKQLEPALEVQERKLGRAHPATINTLNNLGMAYRDWGKPKEAMPFFERASEELVRREFRHPYAAGIINNCAQCLERLKEFERAEIWRRRCLELARKQYGEDSVSCANAIGNLGFNLLVQKKWPEAESLLRSALTIRKKQKADEWTMFNNQAFLGKALLGQQKYADAELLLLGAYEAMKQLEAKLPAEKKKTLFADVAGQLVEIYEATNKPAEAAKWKETQEKVKTANETSKN